jgi:hypothetical protein
VQNLQFTLGLGLLILRYRVDFTVEEWSSRGKSVCHAMLFARGAAGHFFNGDYAAIEHLAAGVLELDGGVADLEIIAEEMVEFEQDAGAL